MRVQELSLLEQVGDSIRSGGLLEVILAHFFIASIPLQTSVASSGSFLTRIEKFAISFAGVRSE
jgi:hypothetical protein